MVFGMRTKSSQRRRNADPDGTQSAALRDDERGRAEDPSTTVPEPGPASAPTSLTWRPAAPAGTSGPEDISPANRTESARASAPADAGSEAGQDTGSAGSSDLPDRIVMALREIYDPEIPVNIYDLGLIYDVDLDADNMVRIRMTLTAPGCPVAGEMPGWVEDAVRKVEGVRDVAVELVWDPMWNPEMMSEAARLELGFM